MSKGSPAFDGMPAKLKDIYGPLWQDVGHLSLNWIAFCQVYGKGPERIKLLMRFGAYSSGVKCSKPYSEILF